MIILSFSDCLIHITCVLMQWDLSIRDTFGTILTVLTQKMSSLLEVPLFQRVSFNGFSTTVGILNVFILVLLEVDLG